MKGKPNPLRSRKVVTDATGTRWLTSTGGVFVEPVQRPDAKENTVTLTVTLPASDYKLLEVLQDDVAHYIVTLISSHVRGLIKSAEHNAKVKKNGNK